MDRPRSGTARPAFALALLTAACGTAPEPAGHVHCFTTTITVTADALLPASTVSIPAMSTVVWRNKSPQDLTIEFQSMSCPGCDTVFAFAAGPNGARAATIAPGAVATMCFHEAGSYPFVVHAGGRDRTGAIEVGGAP